ncbi:MAG: hypothetical protein A3J96_00260 [Sulfurimonas sp. RIFOXYC2_FULL_36_7]|nr:MAG: hypothetical protein A3J96_00260 [Sulfurimonas sp. RIFOXYC2_FULL_36_7]
MINNELKDRGDLEHSDRKELMVLRSDIEMLLNICQKMVDSRREWLENADDNIRSLKEWTDRLLGFDHSVQFKEQSYRDSLYGDIEKKITEIDKNLQIFGKSLSRPQYNDLSITRRRLRDALEQFKKNESKKKGRKDPDVIKNVRQRYLEQEIASRYKKRKIWLNKNEVIFSNSTVSIKQLQEIQIECGKIMKDLESDIGLLARESVIPAGAALRQLTDQRSELERFLGNLFIKIKALKGKESRENPRSNQEDEIKITEEDIRKVREKKLLENLYRGISIQKDWLKKNRGILQDLNVKVEILENVRVTCESYIKQARDAIETTKKNVKDPRESILEFEAHIRNVDVFIGLIDSKIKEVKSIDEKEIEKRAETLKERAIDIFNEKIKPVFESILNGEDMDVVEFFRRISDSEIRALNMKVADICKLRVVDNGAAAILKSIIMSDTSLNDKKNFRKIQLKFAADQIIGIMSKTEGLSVLQKDEIIAKSSLLQQTLNIAMGKLEAESRK